MDIQKILISTLEKFLTQLFEFIPNFVQAIVIILIGWLIAKLLMNLIKKVLSKVGLDKLGESINKIEFVKDMGVEIKLSEVLAKVIYYFTLLSFISAATQMLKMQVITDMVAKLMILIPKVIVAGVMLMIGIFIADSLKKTVIQICASLKITSGRLLGSIVFFFVFIIALIAALGQAEINTTLLESSFNIIIGGVIFAFAVGYGMASRDVLANILSSFYTKNKFKEGQIIAIEGVKGEIVAMDNTTITLQTNDTKTIFPLNVLQTKKVEVFEEKSLS